MKQWRNHTAWQPAFPWNCKGYEGKITEIPDDPKVRFQALHHQFVASAKAVKLAHEKYPEYLIGDMNVFMTKYPFTCNPEDVLATQKEMRIMNWFCSDVQVRRRISGVYGAVF